MEIKPAGKIPYTENQWNDYKARLANTLAEKAVDSDQVFDDPQLKEFITNYAEKELLSEKNETLRLIQNINIRLAHMDLETSKGKRTFPIVNEYKGHHLMRTYYFSKEASGICKMECVEVVDKGLILL